MENNLSIIRYVDGDKVMHAYFYDNKNEFAISDRVEFTLSRKIQQGAVPIM